MPRIPLKTGTKLAPSALSTAKYLLFARQWSDSTVSHVFLILITACRGIFSLYMRKLVKLFAEDNITGMCWNRDSVSDFFGPQAQTLKNFTHAVFWVKIVNVETAIPIW